MYICQTSVPVSCMRSSRYEEKHGDMNILTPSISTKRGTGSRPMGDVRSVEVREGLIRAESKVHWLRQLACCRNGGEEKGVWGTRGLMARVCLVSSRGVRGRGRFRWGSTADQPMVVHDQFRLVPLLKRYS